jgi:Flp pilus assembly protein protease CpaA
MIIWNVPESIGYFFIVFMFGILGVATYFDLKERRVPNWLWFIATIPVPATFIGKFLWFEFIFVLGMIAYSYVLWRYDVWGMGDVKTTVWLSLMASGPFALLTTFLAMLVAWVWKTVRKKEGLGDAPFLPYILISSFIMILGIGLYSLYA